METASIRHQNCKMKTKWKGHFFVGHPFIYINGNCTSATTSEYKDSKNMNISTLHLTGIFGFESNITEQRIRDLLVFQDVTSRDKIQSSFISSHTIFPVNKDLTPCIERILLI